MLILLPPSETKRPGGSGPALELDALALGGLTAQRELAVDALIALSEDPERAATVLKLGERQRGEIAVNAALREAPTMAAIDRYTGVLYDALDAASLDRPARRWLAGHALIHSAPFGPVGALDPIPAYRLGAGTAVPGLPPLRRLWADAVTSALREAAPAFVLDLRSEAYVALGPVPDDIPAAYVRVVVAGEDGAVRALNHFNKHAKGELVRLFATGRPRTKTPAGILAWMRDRGLRVETTAAEWRLYVT